LSLQGERYLSLQGERYLSLQGDRKGSPLLYDDGAAQA